MSAFISSDRKACVIKCFTLAIRYSWCLFIEGSFVQRPATAWVLPLLGQYQDVTEADNCTTAEFEQHGKGWTVLSKEAHILLCK